MTDSQKLLEEYAERGSESAFRELVTRYINLVYAAALRLVDGDTQLAEDVTQIVFIHLAKTGRSLSRDVMLGGWLHQNTFYVATKLMRSEHRRKTREREAMEMNLLQEDDRADWRRVSPMLDEAITQLGSEDRTAILLRFFEQRDFRSVGEALGSNEDAARMRVNRALEKLHSLLKQRGVTLSIAALGALLAAGAATAAPAGLAGSISSIALAGAAAGTGTTLTLLKLMANTKLKLGLATLLVAGAASTVVVQHQSQVKLREENQSFRGQIAQLKNDLERLSNVPVQTTEPTSLAGDQLQELLRLRGEVGALRQKTNELAKLRENQNLLSRTAQESEASTNQMSAEDQYILRERHTSAAMIKVVMAIKNYASNHGGQYPVSFDQLTASGSLETTNFPGNVGLADFQMEKEGTRDEQGYRILVSLRVPIPTKPGFPSLSILGEISDAGKVRTRGVNVNP